MPRRPGVIGVREGVGRESAIVGRRVLQFAKSIAKSWLRLVGSGLGSPFCVVANGFVSQSEAQR